MVNMLYEIISKIFSIENFSIWNNIENYFLSNSSIMINVRIRF